MVAVVVLAVVECTLVAAGPLGIEHTQALEEQSMEVSPVSYQTYLVPSLALMAVEMCLPVLAA